MRPFLAAMVPVVLLLFAGCVQPETEHVVRWSAPEDVEAGALTVVRWEVEGSSAEVTHAELHAGPVSVKEPKASSYATTFRAQNRTVPGRFDATALFADEGVWFLRPHVVVGGEAAWGKERNVEVRGGLSLHVSVPPFVRLGVGDGANATLTSSRAATVTHYGLHRTDDGSLAGLWHAMDELAADGGVPAYALELPERDDVSFPAPPLGWNQLRLHVIEDDAEFWSGAFELTTVDLRVRLVDPPSEAPAGEPIRFAWSVEGAPVVLTAHTGIHYADAPWQTLGGNVTVAAMAHEGGDDPVAVPGEFALAHTFDEPGSRFLRAHLRLGSGAGALDLFSEPHEVRIT